MLDKQLAFKKCYGEIDFGPFSKCARTDLYFLWRAGRCICWDEARRFGQLELRRLIFFNYSPLNAISTV